MQVEYKIAKPIRQYYLGDNVMKENDLIEAYLELSKENQNKLLIFARSLAKTAHNPQAASYVQSAKTDK